MNRVLLYIFWGVLVYSLLILWQRWEEYNQRHTTQTTQSTQGTQAAGQHGSSTSPTFAGDSDPAANPDAPPQPTQSLRAASGAVSGSDTAPDAGNIVKIETDWMIVDIAENGGDIIGLHLKKHRDTASAPFAVFEHGVRQHDMQSGLIGGESLPDHRAVYTLLASDSNGTSGTNGTGANDASDYRQTVQGDSLAVSLRANQDGVALIKTYIFHRDSYMIEEALAVENNRDAPIAPLAYFRLSHNGAPPEEESSFLPTFFGAAVFTDADKFIKVPMEDIGSDTYPRKSQDGWIGMVQRYFAAVLLPPENVEREYFMQQAGRGARIGFIAPFGDILPSQSATLTTRIFAGAQEQDILNTMHESAEAPGIHLVVDYGWLTVIAVLLFKLLAWIQQFAGNWGLSVVLLTFLIKLLFYPLANISYRSLARMKEISPRIKTLQETYGDDKQRMQQALMALYREKKINPLGGCLPILAQIPVFIALYWVILGSVELRHAPFYGWITDLSAPDPYFILPLCMGAAMFLQMRMSPTPPDSTQAMIMKIMPIFFTIFSIFFPSGLVLYWLVNTLLSIAQQWYITRTLARAQSSG